MTVQVGQYRHVAPAPLPKRPPMRLKDLERIYKKMEKKK